MLLAVGSAIELTSVLGITVMRDALDRLHYVGMASFGAFAIAVAIVLRTGFTLLGDKALAAGAALALLSPVVVHVTARALRMRRHGDWRAGIERHRMEDS